MSEPTKIDGLKKADVIKRIVTRSIESKAWRSQCETEALVYLEKSEKARKADVIAFIREQYDAAGAGFSGRWQG